ncbi:MAG: ribbon-helix-helix protein, CopG family [Pseudomonadota bacterium]
MRALVDIPDQQVAELAAICETRKISRAEVIRLAISSYLEKHRVTEGEAFGIWKSTKEDGLAYQNRVRSEW